MRFRASGLAAIALLLLVPNAHAAGVALGVNATTGGAGLALTVGVVKPLNVRVGGQLFSLNRTREEDGTTYDARLRLRSGMLLADLHPFGGHFRVSGGIYYSRNEVTAFSTEESFVTLNGIRYPVALFGQVSGRARPENDACPYLGLGWGNAVRPGGRVHLAVDVGAYYQGSPRVSLTATPSPGVPESLVEEFRRDLEAERADIEEDVSDYTFYPVVSLGLSYRF